MTEGTLDYLFVFVLIEPNFKKKKNPQLFLLLLDIFLVVKDLLSCRLVMECFVESLSCLPMMKSVERL
jgi:hypothetical protein